ncbi:hypothetical protein R80B4_01620 [Fibrobacteres bacterium R8-0-B4]
MNKYSYFKSVILLCCILVFSACRQKNADTQIKNIETAEESAHRQDLEDKAIPSNNETILSSKILTKLPFDFDTYFEWSIRYDMGETDEKLYIPSYVEHNETIRSLYINKWSNDTIPGVFYQFETNKEFDLYLFWCSIDNVPSYIFRVVSIHHNEIIDGITVCSSVGEETNIRQQSFIITENFEIIISRNKYSSDRLISTSVVAEYKILDDGKIIKIGKSYKKDRL